jgi:hypothetical protein
MNELYANKFVFYIGFEVLRLVSINYSIWRRVVSYKVHVSLEIKLESSSEMLINIYQNSRSHISEDNSWLKR